ncbi:MAG: helix-turn-helix domain-containing protein [Defluviitaleaceae bacterium]|nr:helix-turn-helix domain-containing protein [Defluviitaleaceae bacterium]
MGLSLEEREGMELEILEQFPKLRGNSLKDLHELKFLENSINRYFKKIGKSTPQLLDILKIIEIFEKDYKGASFEKLCLIAKPIIKRLGYLEIKNWDIHDISIAEAVVPFAETFEKANEFSEKIFKAIKKHVSKEKINKAKYSVHVNILINFLKMKFFEVDETWTSERFEELEKLFKYHSNEALKICKLEGEKTRKFEFIILIRLAIWDKNSDEVIKNLTLLKDTGDRHKHKIMREEVASYSFHPEFELNEAQSLIFIGDNITKRREQLGISIEDFIDELGYSDSHVYKMERGEVNMPFNTLVKISKMLNISLDELCFRKNRTQKKSF